jgi:hypothetical protein
VVPPELLVAVPERFPSASNVYLATAAKGTATVPGITQPVSMYAQSPATAAAEQTAFREESSSSDGPVRACTPCADPTQSMAITASVATVVRVRFNPVMAYFIDFSFSSG